MGPIPLEIAKLLLDLENPRITGAKSQREALQKIVADQEDKLLALAESIVEDEGMNPLDRFLVVRGPDAGKFTVLEGNRRLAALKILNTASILDGISLSPSLKHSFDKLSKRFDPASVEPLAAFEVANREAGLKWILLRHTGQNDGKGVVPWSALASTRFRGKDPALQALAFVAAHGNLTVDQQKLLESFPITTLDRLLSSREVRQRLGFEVKNGKLLSGLKPDELIKPLRQIVLDLAEGRKNVSQLKNKQQQIEYVEKDFDAGSKPDLTTIGALRHVDDLSEADFSSKPSQASSRKKKGSTDPSQRKTLVPKGVSVSISDNRIASIFGELRRIKLDDAPNAIAVLFRVFLELSIDHYMRANSIKPKYKDPKSGKEYDKNLKTKLKEVVDHLVANGADRKDYQT